MKSPRILLVDSCMTLIIAVIQPLVSVISECYDFADWYYIFQVADMRWGIRDEALDDHSTTEICLSEIENCRKLSVGPNFMVNGGLTIPI